ncbi:MAG: phosphoribosylglycinamide formyltransferase [Cyclobacteriaceae bacterium]|jgi:phosphoribosylglycinamide formyltransferase-1|nr:phosphoribosylglycinamide formyltransferase [Flammeovirgaceae bacterium]
MTNARLAIFASGNGTNAEAFFRYFKHHLRVQVAALISSRPDAFALTRARQHGVESLVVDKEMLQSGDLVAWLQQRQITHIVLAGFNWMIPTNLLQAFPDRIVNIHPALLPAFGGKGMYGIKVHEAVKKSGVSETGITIHLVNEHYDEGRILFQARCPVAPNDTPEAIAQNVHQLEHSHYPHVVEQWIG